MSRIKACLCILTLLHLFFLWTNSAATAAGRITDRDVTTVPVPTPATSAPVAQNARFTSDLFAAGSAVQTSVGLATETEHGVRIVNPKSGRAVLSRPDWCLPEGAFGDVVAVRECASQRSAFYDLAEKALLWETSDRLIAVSPVAVITVCASSADGSVDLCGRSPRGGYPIWRRHEPCPVSEFGPGSIDSNIAVVRWLSACNVSAVGGRKVYRLDTGSEIDEDQDIDPSAFVHFGSTLLTWSGGGRWGRYEPARIKIYKVNPGSLEVAFYAAPNPPVGDDVKAWGSVSAKYVGISNENLYVGIDDDVFVYSLLELYGDNPRPLPLARKLDAALGSWLGAQLENRLFFSKGLLMLAVDVKPQSDTAAVIARDGPFTKMIMAGSIGYAVTSDRRIVSIDMQSGVIIRETFAQPCWDLQAVFTWSTSAIAVCSTRLKGRAIAIGV